MPYTDGRGQGRVAASNAKPAPAPTQAPAPTEAPTQAPLIADEVMDAAPHPSGPPVPAKQSKLSKAMGLMQANVDAIQALSVNIDALATDYPATFKFDVKTKAGVKIADDVRKRARAARLDVKKLADASKGLLNDLKAEAKAVAEPYIERMAAIEENAKGQLDAEGLRTQRHEDNILAITNLALQLPEDSDGITARMSALEAVVVDESYEEFQERATKAVQQARDTLTCAFAATMQREQETAAAKARELAEAAARQAAEAKSAGARERIRAIKDLPDQCAGTGSENLREALRIHEAAVPHADVFGDLLEFAEMAHELTSTKLRRLLDEAIAEECPPLEPDPVIPAHQGEIPASHFQHVADDGAEVLAPQDDEPAGPVDEAGTDRDPGMDGLAFVQPAALDEVGTDRANGYLAGMAARGFEPDPATVGRLRTAAEQAWLSTPEAFGDPFSNPPAPTYAPRAVAATPSARGLMPRGITPTATPAPAPTENFDLTAPDADVPDLLHAAKAFIETVNTPDPNSRVPFAMPVAWTASYHALCAAVAFVSEFAD